MTRHMKNPKWPGGYGHPELQPYCERDGCVPAEPEEEDVPAVKPARRMAANPGEVDFTRHGREHVENSACKLDPPCVPVDDLVSVQMQSPPPPGPTFTIETRYINSAEVVLFTAETTGWSYTVTGAGTPHRDYGFESREVAVDNAKRWCDEKAKAMQPVETIIYRPEAK